MERILERNGGSVSVRDEETQKESNDTELKDDIVTIISEAEKDRHELNQFKRANQEMRGVFHEMREANEDLLKENTRLKEQLQLQVEGSTSENNTLPDSASLSLEQLAYVGKVANNLVNGESMSQPVDSYNGPPTPEPDQVSSSSAQNVQGEVEMSETTELLSFSLGCVRDLRQQHSALLEKLAHLQTQKDEAERNSEDCEKRLQIVQKQNKTIAAGYQNKFELLKSTMEEMVPKKPQTHTATPQPSSLQEHALQLTKLHAQIQQKDEEIAKRDQLAIQAELKIQELETQLQTRDFEIQRYKQVNCTQTFKIYELEMKCDPDATTTQQESRVGDTSNNPHATFDEVKADLINTRRERDIYRHAVHRQQVVNVTPQKDPIHNEQISFDSNESLLLTSENQELKNEIKNLKKSVRKQNKDEMRKSCSPENQHFLLDSVKKLKQTNEKHSRRLAFLKTSKTSLANKMKKKNKPGEKSLQTPTPKKSSEKTKRSSASTSSSKSKKKSSKDASALPTAPKAKKPRESSLPSATKIVTSSSTKSKEKS